MRAIFYVVWHTRPSVCTRKSPPTTTTTRAEVEAHRKAFIRKWRLKHRAVADSLEEAGERLLTSFSIFQVLGRPQL